MPTSAKSAANKIPDMVKDSVRTSLAKSCETPSENKRAKDPAANIRTIIGCKTG